MRQQILNSASLAEWPNLRLRPQKVTVGQRTEIRLHPHFGEFDFEAAFSSSLGYEREVFICLESRMQGYGAIIEIGANVGVFTTFFFVTTRKAAMPVQIIAFEPSRQAYVRLLENLRLNEAENVQVFNCAVGESPGFVSFFEPEGHLTNGSLDPGFAGKFSSKVTRTQTLVVDGVMVESLVSTSERILVKIDTEGAEARVLRSLEGFIRRNRPDLIIEVLSDYEQELNSLAFLRECGYRAFHITAAGLVEHETFAAGAARDYLLVCPNPRERVRASPRNGSGLL